MAFDPTQPPTNGPLLSAPIRDNFAALNGLVVGGVINPMTAPGDLIRGGTAGAPTRLPVGTNGHVLTLAAGLPTWAAPAGGASFPLLAPDGSAAAPSYSWTNAPTSGLYLSGPHVRISDQGTLVAGANVVSGVGRWQTMSIDVGYGEVVLASDGSNILAQKNGANLQKLRVYGDATNYTEISGVAGLTTTVVNGSGVSAIVALTQAAYDGLGTKVATTLYVITP